MTTNDSLPKQLDKRRLDGKPRVGAKARINGALGTATAARKAVDKPPQHAAKGGTRDAKGRHDPRRKPEQAEACQVRRPLQRQGRGVGASESSHTARLRAGGSGGGDECGKITLRPHGGGGGPGDLPGRKCLTCSLRHGESSQVSRQDSGTVKLQPRKPTLVAVERGAGGKLFHAGRGIHGGHDGKDGGGMAAEARETQAGRAAPELR